MGAPLSRILETDNYAAELARAAALLSEGQLVVLPTETVYGVAALLTSPSARERIAQVRSADDKKPLTIHLASAQDASRYLGDVSELGRRMMRKLWPGPVALRFEVPAERRQAVAKELDIDESAIYDGQSIMLRCPDHPATRQVLQQVGGPVVMTVASGVGSASPSPADLAETLGDRVALVVDAGPTRFSRPSTIVRVGKDDYEIVREGVFDRRIIERMLRTTILYVCSGNTCRSPMAEALTRKLLAHRLNVSEAELESKGFYVRSAGALAMPGARATPQAVEAVRELQADLTKHRSQALTLELIHQSDLILVMSSAHARAVQAMAPSASDKIVLLSDEGDIEDPIGAEVAVYRSLAAKMEQLIEKRLTERGLLQGI